jgi:hypothetical protein
MINPHLCWNSTHYFERESLPVRYLYKYPREAIQWLNRSTLCTPTHTYKGNEIKLVHALYPIDSALFTHANTVS